MRNSFRLLCGLLAVGLVACNRPPRAEDTPAPLRSDQRPADEAPRAGPRVLLLPGGGGPPSTVYVELARSEQEITRGLMFRKELAADRGMLFLFDRPEIRRFWMRNTYVPLDMLFFDGEQRLVGVEADTVPLDDTGRGPDTPAQYVLEVVAGYARRHGLGPGARAEFVGVN